MKLRVSNTMSFVNEHKEREREKRKVHHKIM